MRPVLTVVYGASGHGKVVCDILLAGAVQVDGFIDSNATLQGTQLLGIPVLGTESWIAEKIKDSAIRVALGIGDQKNRKTVAEKCGAMGAEIITVAHPKAIVAKSAQLGEGTVVMAGAMINPDVRIGIQTHSRFTHGHLDARLAAFA